MFVGYGRKVYDLTRRKKNFSSRGEEIEKTTFKNPSLDLFFHFADHLLVTQLDDIINV